MMKAETISFLSILLSSLVEASKTPESPACDSSSEASLILFAHSIKKFTDTCVPNGLPNCEDITCMKMHETFANDKCHARVMKCATDTTCAFHSQAIPYSLYTSGVSTTCQACTTNPGELIEKLDSNTKRAAAVCKFEHDNLEEPSTHTECQTTECHAAMKSIHLKCLSAWVRGFSWVPTATDDIEAKIGAYTKASIACDPTGAKVQFSAKGIKNDTKASRAFQPIPTKANHLDLAESAITQVPLGLEEGTLSPSIKETSGACKQSGVCASCIALFITLL